MKTAAAKSSLSHLEEVRRLAHAYQRRSESVLEPGDLGVAVCHVLLLSLVVPPLHVISFNSAIAVHHFIRASRERSEVKSVKARWDQTKHRPQPAKEKGAETPVVAVTLVL